MNKQFMNKHSYHGIVLRIKRTNYWGMSLVPGQGIKIPNSAQDPTRCLAWPKKKFLKKKELLIHVTYSPDESPENYGDWKKLTVKGC